VTLQSESADMAKQWDGMTWFSEEEYMALRDAGRWIPVSERLPEKNEPVCVSCGGKVTVGTYSPMMDDWWALVLPATGVQPTDSVTHWMPLPEPPEVK
jgi:hypothetical protein